MSVHKKDIVQAIAEELSITDQDTGLVVQAFLDKVIEILGQHDRLELRNFGVFEIVEQGERTLKHPVTGKPIHVPPQKVIHFKAGKRMKESIQDRTAAKDTIKG